MTALTAGYRHSFQLQYFTPADHKPRQDKTIVTEVSERNTRRVINAQAQFDEIEALLNEMREKQKAIRQQPAQREPLSDDFATLSLRANRALFSLGTSAEMARKENREKLQLLEKRLVQLLAEEQQEVTDRKAINSRDSVSLPAAIKKAWSQQANTLVAQQDTAPVSKPTVKTAAILPFATPFQIQQNLAKDNVQQTQAPHLTQQAETQPVSAVAANQQVKSAPAEDVPDAAILQQLAEDLVMLAGELDQSWKEMLEQARNAVITVLVNNPAVLKQNPLPQIQPQSEDRPPLVAPTNSRPTTIEMMLMALRVLRIENSSQKIETDNLSAKATQDYQLAIANHRLKENRELQDKARQQQESARKRGILFKWLTRIVMAVVGLVISALTAGTGAMLVGLLFTVVDVVLEETLGFSLTGKLVEGLGKGFSAAIRAMGATGSWVEHVANALAQIMIIILSILVTKGVSKLSNTAGVQKVLNAIKDKLPKIGKSFIGAPDIEKLSKPLQFVARNKSWIQAGTGSMTTLLAAIEAGYSVPRAKTQRDLAANQAELHEADFIDVILNQMIKDLPNALTQSTEMTKEYAEMASNMLTKMIQRNRTIALNLANAARQ